jgi:hypothetical protein
MIGLLHFKIFSIGALFFLPLTLEFDDDGRLRNLPRTGAFVLCNTSCLYPILFKGTPVWHQLYICKGHAMRFKPFSPLEMCLLHIDTCIMYVNTCTHTFDFSRRVTLYIKKY